MVCIAIFARTSGWVCFGCNGTCSGGVQYLYPRQYVYCIYIHVYYITTRTTLQYPILLLLFPPNTDIPVTDSQTTHYIRFSTLPYEMAYSKLNVYSEGMVNAVLSKAVLDALNSSIINTVPDNFFSDTQLKATCNNVSRCVHEQLV